MKRSSVLALIVALVSTSAWAYRFYDIRSPLGQNVRILWQNLPIAFLVNNTSPRDFTLQQMIDVTRASTQTWQDLPTSSVTFQYGGTTGASPQNSVDSLNTIGFTNDPSLVGTGILGVTQIRFNAVTGALVEADIFLNNDFPWSVAPNGTTGRADTQSVLTHEVGHFFGLSHSAVGVRQVSATGQPTVLVGSAIMFPRAFPLGSITGRTLTVDDTTAASVLYPLGTFTSDTGALAGRVTKGGQGLLGASVVAFNPFTGETAGQFTNSNGNYRIDGLRPGPYVVRVESITAPIVPEDYGFASSQVDLNYRDKLYSGRAEVTPGGTTDNVNFEVSP